MIQDYACLWNDQNYDMLDSCEYFENQQDPDRDQTDDIFDRIKMRLYCTYDPIAKNKKLQPRLSFLDLYEDKRCKTGEGNFKFRNVVLK